MATGAEAVDREAGGIGLLAGVRLNLYSIYVAKLCTL